MNDFIDDSQAATFPSEAKGFLKETAKWAKFIAIVGFIGTGLMVFMSLLMGSVFASMPPNPMMPISPMFITVFQLLGAVFVLIPNLYLFKFAKRTLSGIDGMDDTEVISGLDSLKSYFKFVGIVFAVIIGLYALGFLAAFMAYLSMT